MESKITEERMIKLYKDYACIEISTNISDFENVDCHIYSESTADGYDVYVCTNNVRQPSICEDVYYYDSDLADAFEEQIRYGDSTFYICDGIYDDCYFNDKLLELFADNVEDIVQEAEDGISETDITLQEINILKEEHGLNEEEIEETVS